MSAVAASSAEPTRLLHRAFVARGLEVAPWALRERCGPRPSLASVADCAREHGLEADLFELADGDAGYLALGALVALSSGELASVVGHASGGTSVERADGGRVKLDRRSTVRAVMALELRAPPRGGPRFFTLLLSRLGAEPHVVRAVVLAAALGVVLVGLGVAGPALTHAALALALPERAENVLELLGLGAALLGAQIAYVGRLRRRALLYLSTKLSEKASIDVASHTLRLPLERLRSIDVGEVHQATSSAAAAAEAIPTFAPQLVDAALGLVYLVYAFVLDPTSAAIVAAAGAFVVTCGVVNGRRRFSLQREYLARSRREQQALYEMIVGVETVKSEAVEGPMLVRWLERLAHEEKTSLALRQQRSVFTTALAAVDRIVFGTVLLVLAHRCIANGASVADLVAAVQVSAAFMLCAEQMAQLPASLAEYRGHVERVETLLTTPAEQPQTARPAVDPRAPAVVVEDLWFRYEADAPWVLGGIGFVARKGETVVLSWPSGAGKSTLLRLLAGLATPTRGDVLLHGVDAANARRAVTYVPQQASLFPLSIMENLQVLSGNAPKERILAMARATGLLDMVAEWGMGLDTLVSVGVTNMSSGQRQLILYTAAAASETPIVLLDEALAHVDLRLRATLGAKNLFAGRTVIAVVHDASAREVAGARVVALHAVASA